MFYNSYKGYTSHRNRLTSAVKVLLAALAVVNVLAVSLSSSYARHSLEF